METLASLIVKFLVENEYISHYHMVQGGKGAQLRLDSGKVIVLILSELRDKRFDHTLDKNRTTKK